MLSATCDWLSLSNSSTMRFHCSTRRQWFTPYGALRILVPGFLCRQRSSHGRPDAPIVEAARPPPVTRSVGRRRASELYVSNDGGQCARSSPPAEQVERAVEWSHAAAEILTENGREGGGHSFPAVSDSAVHPHEYCSTGPAQPTA